MKNLLILFLLTIVCITAIGTADAKYIDSPTDALKNIIKATDVNNITVSYATDGSGGLLFRSAGEHTRYITVSIPKGKIKKFDTFLSFGSIAGWHSDKGRQIVLLRDTGIEIEFDIELTETCVGCFTGTYTQSWNLRNISQGNTTFSQTLNNITTLLANITDYSNCPYGPYDINNVTCFNTTGLVLWLKMDEGAGPYTNDSSGMNNNGTFTGNGTVGTGWANWTTGKYNTGVNFSVDDKITTFAMTVGKNFTLSAWANWTGGINIRVIDRDHGLYIRSDARVECLIKNTTGSNKFVTGTRQINRNVLYHLACTYDNTTDTAVLYVNGKSETISTGLGGARSLNVVTSIGASGTSLYWNGTIDDVRIWNHSLDTNEMYTLYHTGIRQLQVRATGNESISLMWNGSANNPLNVPIYFTEHITGLNYTIPEPVNLDNILIYDSINTSMWNITVSAIYIENTTTISESTSGEYYYLNTSIVLAQPCYANCYNNYTITSTDFINSLNKGTASILGDANATVTFAGLGGNWYVNISSSYIGSNILTYQNVTIQFNNTGIASPLLYNLSGFVLSKLDIPILNAKLILNGTTMFTAVNGSYYFQNVSGNQTMRLYAYAIGHANYSTTINISNDTIMNISMKEYYSGLQNKSMNIVNIGGVIFMLLLLVYTKHIYNRDRNTLQ